MKGRHITEILVDLLYDELPEDRKQAALEHLEECPQCAREYEELKKTLDVYQKLPDPGPPDHLKTRIMAHAKEKAAPKPRWKKTLQPVIAVAAALIIGVGLFVVYNGQDKEAEIAGSDNWIEQAAKKSRPDKKSRSTAKAPEAGEVTPPRLLARGTASERPAPTLAGTVEGYASNGTTLGGTTGYDMDLAGATLEGATLAGTDCCTGLEGTSAQAGTTVMFGDSMLAKGTTVLPGGSEEDALLDGGSPSVTEGETALMEGETAASSTATEVARLEMEDPDFILAREERMTEKPGKETAPEEDPGDEVKTRDRQAKDKKENTSWGWMGGAADMEEPGSTAGPAKTEEQPQGPEERKAKKTTKPGPAPKTAAGTEQRETYQLETQTRLTLKRADLSRRALGCRAAISAYEEALEDMGYGPEKTPKCAPVIKSTIKSALDCYYKLGEGDKALKLEKWREKVCP